ncbi:MAG: hypothetical protein H0X66_02615 [Verrucomicrobia bacterium]|nr:hypothetical protein [Verrucomicrobiota bacterium]
MNRELILRRRVKWLTWFFIFGLVISGITAIPLEWEMELLTKIFGIAHLTPEQAESGLARWLLIVRDALKDTNAAYPFIAYGFDWLAFGHIVIAVAFIGALRDPVRNIWLFEFGMIACAMIIPWAFIFGEVRGIPIPWRLIDCAFGIVGVFPLWLARKWTKEISLHG